MRASKVSITVAGTAALGMIARVASPSGFSLN
jgi:hypothetical protein